MKLTFLGTGTSHGVPVIACDCPVCKSKDPHNKRTRSSVLIQTEDNKHILIDIGPDFRTQALRENIREIDTVLLTHSHADHLFGIDDLRNFSCIMSKKPENPQNEKYNKSDGYCLLTKLHGDSPLCIMVKTIYLNIIIDNLYFATLL